MAVPGSSRVRLSLAAAGAIALHAAVASAGSINLMQFAPAHSAGIVFDRAILDRTADDVSALVDERCMLVDDEQRNTGASARARYEHGGRIVWAWEPEPAYQYVICLDAPTGEMGFGGGLHLPAALSWLNRSSTAASGASVLAGGDGAGALDVSVAAPIAPPLTPWSAGGPTTISPDRWPVAVDRQSSWTEFAAAMNDQMTVNASVNGSGSGLFSTISPLDPAAMLLAPGEAIPAPEPGTWLLVGTGIAAAWRARRRR